MIKLNSFKKKLLKLGYPLPAVKSIKDLTGKQFGLLLVKEPVSRNDAPSIYKHKHKQMFWRCECKCGGEVIAIATSLQDGKRKSCGCVSGRYEKGHTRHGTIRPWYHKKFLDCWYNMNRRCTDTKGKDYHNYGGRGITVDKLWHEGFGKNKRGGKTTRGFEQFSKDMLKEYLAHVKVHGEYNTTIDRVDVNGNYCKENCRFATKQVQSANKRNSK